MRRAELKNTRVTRHRSTQNGMPLTRRARLPKKRRGSTGRTRLEPGLDGPEVTRRREKRVADWIEWAQEPCGLHEAMACASCRPMTMRERELYADRSGS